jgi:hypothetical protein
VNKLVNSGTESCDLKVKSKAFCGLIKYCIKSQTLTTKLWQASCGSCYKKTWNIYSCSDAWQSTSGSASFTHSHYILLVCYVSCNFLWLMLYWV